MGAAKVWGWILLILGILQAVRILMGKVNRPIISWIIAAVLLIIGIILLLKKSK